jgi:hypothetical protein
MHRQKQFDPTKTVTSMNLSAKVQCEGSINSEILIFWWSYSFKGPIHYLILKGEFTFFTATIVSECHPTTERSVALHIVHLNILTFHIFLNQQSLFFTIHHRKSKICAPEIPWLISPSQVLNATPWLTLINSQIARLH